MKNNFTQNEAKILVEKNSPTHAQPKGKSLLAFVRKIVEVISLLFEPKGKKKSAKTTSSFIHHSAVSIEDKTLQEYFIDEQNKHLNQEFISVVNQEPTVNDSLIKTDSTVKEFRLSSHFDQNLRQWVSVFSPPIHIYNEENDKPSKNSTYRGLATTILLVLFSILGVAAQTSVDLSLKQSIDNSLPTLNGSVKYTLWLKNSGPSSVSTIVVQDNFPIGGATLTSHNGGANFNYTPGTGLGLWSVASLASGDSVKLEIIANVIARGVFFNIAEVKSIGTGQKDIDSTPNNSVLSEDDMAASCFSVPLFWYPGEQFNVSVPAPFKYGMTIKWFRGVTEITGTTTQAVVNADTSLTIKAPGNYSFTSNVSTCPAQGCCAVQVIEGSYGSIGDYVWIDTNNNGLNDDGQTGVSDVIIELYASDAIGLPIGSILKKDTTDNNGKYLFTGLSEGNYVLKVITSTLPAGTQITTKQHIGSDETIDNDFNTSTGLSDKVLINLNDIAKKEVLTVDAGLYRTPALTIADLSVIKTVSNSTPNQGDLITYYIDVKNDGPAIATNVEVSDIVPTGLQVISATGGDLIDIAGNTVIAKVNQIAIGKTTTFQIVAKVTASTGTIKNWTQITKSDQKDSNSTPNNGTDKAEDDDDDADIIIKQTSCNSTTPLIACSNPYISLGESITIDAIGCNGTIVWSDGQTGNSIKITPNVTITYTAQCKINDNCISPKSNSVTVIVNAIAAPLISSNYTTNIICGGGKITLTANNCTGTITWSTGETTTNIEVSPTSTTSYTAVCKKGGLVSGKSNSIIVTIGSPNNPPTIATKNSTICVGQTAVLTASNCSGTVVWSNGSTGTSLSLTPTATGTYTAVCKVGECSSASSSTLTITVSPTEALTIIANNESMCVGESAILKVTGCNGNLLWTTGATTSTITVTPTITTTYEVKCGTGECAGKTTKAITVTTKPTAPIVTCGKERICAGESLTFTAHGCEGSVTWSSGATGSTMIVTPTVTTSYSSICTVNGCTSEPSKSYTIEIINQIPPTITATSETVCSGGTVTLTAANCAGKVLWNTGATTFAITANPTIATTYTVKCIIEDCEKSTSKTINIGGGTAPIAPIVSTNQSSLCGNDKAILTANGCENGTIKWNTGATSSTISVGTGNYTATCSNSCGESTKSNIITILSGGGTAPTISASIIAICEPGNVTLSANGCTGTLIWSNGQTDSSFTVNIATTTTFTATCKVGSCESNKSNEITVTVGKPNKPTISSNKTTICAGDALLLTALGCTGTTIWSNGLTGSPITVNPANTTNYTAVCKLPQGGCTSDLSEKITVNVISKAESPIISYSASRICQGDTLTLNALGCAGTVIWSSGQTTTSINIHPTATTAYTAICKVGSCESPQSAAATINVGNPLAPIINSKNTQVCSGTSTQIEAAGCTGTVKWSDGQVGAVITVSPKTLTSYWAICDGGKCQSEKSNIITVQVTGSGLTKPTVKDLVNICPFTTVDLTTGVTSKVSSQGGVFVFRTGTTSGSPAVSNASAVGTGTYYVFEKAGNGCYSDAGKINVNITTCLPVNPSCVNNPATVKLGKDSTVCLSDDFLTLKGQIGGSASSAKWTTTDGTGTFENSLSLSTKYFYTKEDLIKGNISFILTTNDPDDNGPCVAAKDTFKITLKGVKTTPSIVSNKSPNICFGDSVILTVNEAGIYKWSNGATTKSITVKTPGRYSVKLLSQEGCASLSSNEVVVVLGNAIAAPTVTAIAKNTCPATVMNLSTAVKSSPQTQGGVFEFHTGSKSDSPSISNSTAVGAGTYYVFEKSTIGCYSSGAPIMVMIDQCTANNTSDTTQTELSIEIIGSKAELNIGDPVTFTINVKNNSNKTATNLQIVNVLPKGLEITSSTPGFTAFGKDSLLSIISSLAGGATKTYTYEAKTTKAGKIINIAKITKLDKIDPIISNNISQWTVECKTCQETCVGLALSADTTRQANGSYNITFRALIESCGNLKLEGVKISVNLATMFTAPTTYTIVQKPTAGVGSKLITNDSFNGSTNLSLTIPEGSVLELGIIDTVKFVINILPNGKEGPFATNAIAEAIGNTAFGIPQNVSDASNNGSFVDKSSAVPTVIKLFKSASIGLAKIVLDTTKYANGSYDITYQLLVKNNGSLLLNDVIVRDTLSKVFKAPATFTTVGVPTKNIGSQLAINNAFNGSTDTRLTLPGSTIAIGKTDTLRFKVNVQPDTVKLFTNIAVASGSGTLTNGTKENVTDLSNAGLNPDAPGSNPASLILGSNAVNSIDLPCIGIALFVKDTIKQADDSYNITYNAIIKNCGNLNLSGIQICDTLSKTFNLPAVATIVRKPKLSVGSQLKTDDDYDGVNNTCMLLSNSKIAPNKIDTISWVINVKLNGNKGPFRNTIIVSAKTPSGKIVSDVSNSGINPNADGNTPTVINFNNLPEAIIGISKSASEPKLVNGTTNTYDLTFTFKVKNYGKIVFTGVQIKDNLSVAFGDSVKIDSVNVKADAGFTVNKSFTGRGSLINLLVDSLSTLAVNSERTVTLFTRLTSTSNKVNFENQALAIGRYPSNQSTDDLSTNGSDPDFSADGDPQKNNDGDPRNNWLPTPVKLGTIEQPSVFTTTLGIAKAATLDSVKNADDTYNLTYTVIVKNFSTHKLTNVQLSDSLGQVFADSAEFVLVGKPTLNKNSKLKIDTTFNGRTVTNMLIADSSSLAVGTSDTLIFKLRLLSTKQGDAIYANTITGTAKDSITNVTDKSYSGLNPDPDGDKNPGNNNEPTIITIKGKINVLDSLAIVPEGFSPNGDGNGDMFVITGVNQTDRLAEIYIYNRWGQLIYQNTDFGKEEGWNGVANNGLLIGSKGAGVPDGTYYYYVKAEGLWGDKPKIGFLTLVR